MYSNNSEYRYIFRKYFNMNVSKLEEEFAYLKESDPESYDELLYDEYAMKLGMNTILDKTRENPLFIQLYTLAAGRFLTDDIETGLCVLLTYDFFADFIKVYDTCNLTDTTESYIALKNRLS